LGRELGEEGGSEMPRGMSSWKGKCQQLTKLKDTYTTMINKNRLGAVYTLIKAMDFFGVLSSAYFYLARHGVDCFYR